MVFTIKGQLRPLKLDNSVLEIFVVINLLIAFLDFFDLFLE